MTLIGETRARGDFRQTQPALSNEITRPLQPETDNVTVRGHADRAREHTREVE